MIASNKSVDLSSLVTREGSRSRRKQHWDLSRINAMLDLVESNKARLTYQVFHYMAIQENLIAPNRALPAVFQILGDVPKSWLVCDKRGRYGAKAKTTFKDTPENIESWPFIPAEKAEETYEKLSGAIEHLNLPKADEPGAVGEEEEEEEGEPMGEIEPEELTTPTPATGTGKKVAGRAKPKAMAAR